MKKLILFMLVLFGLVASVNAIDDYSSYYTFENSGNDETSNYNLNAVNMNYVTGVNGQGAHLYQNSRYFERPSQTGSIFTLGFWVKYPTTNNNAYFIDSRGTGVNILSLTTGLSGSGNQISVYDGNNHNFDSLSSYGSNWIYVNIVFNNNVVKTYVNGVEGITKTLSNPFHLDALTRIGKNNIDVQIDDFVIYDRVLTNGEISALYSNNGVPEVTAFSQIQADVNDYYNSSNISIQMSNDWTVDKNIPMAEMFYNLNSNGWISVGQTTSYNLELNNLNEQLHNIEFKAVDNNGETSLSDNFTIDTTKPTINSNFANEINSYTFSTNGSSCSDPNLQSCTISINNQNLNLNSISQITSTVAGNLSYTITATDLAGNSETYSSNILINPWQYIYIKNINGSLVPGIKINNLTVSNPYKFKLYDNPTGNNVVEFRKIGFQKTNISFVTNVSNYLNKTIIVLNAKLNIKFIDSLNKQTIIGITDLSLIGQLGYNFQTTNGLFNISSLVHSGEYKALIKNENYETKELFFNFNNEEVKNIDIYAIPLNSSKLGYVIIKAWGSDSSPATYTKIIAKEWFNDLNTYVSVQQTKTGSDGQAEIKVVLEDRRYLFCIVKNNIETCNPEEIIKTTQNGKTINLVEDVRLTFDKTIHNKLNFREEYIEISNGTGNQKIAKVKFSWNTLDGFESNICVRLIKNYNYSKELVQNDCISAISGSFETIYLLNSTKDYDLNIVYVGDKNLEVPIFQKKILNFSELEETLESAGIKTLVALFILVIGIAGILLFGELYWALIIIVLMVGINNNLLYGIMSPEAISGICIGLGLTARGLRRK